VSPTDPVELGPVGLGPVELGTVELGRIVGVFGFKGEVRLHLDNPDTELLDAPFPVILVGPDGGRRHTRLSARPGAGKRILGRVDGVTDDAGAKALQGFRVLARIADLPPPAEGEVYVWQLEGAEVRIGDALVGRVLGVQESGPVAILEIDVGARDPALVPMVEAFVVSAAPGLVVLYPGALDEG
jgi:16S rRNA processing protein RimM